MTRKHDATPSFWNLARGITSLTFITLTLWIRIQPIATPFIEATTNYGLRYAILDFLPYFYRIHRALGINPSLALGLFIFSMLYVSIAAKTLHIYITRAVFKMGFRAEEAGDHLLLHPRRKP